MDLTPCENVRRAIEFRRPERLPLQFESLGLTDFHHVKWNQIGVGDKKRSSATDEWGCIWQRSEVNNMGQVKVHPMADRSAMHAYRWPDADHLEFYTGMESRFAGGEGRYVTSGIFMLLFERLQALCGFENLLSALYLERDWIEEIADRIEAFDLGIIANLSKRFPGLIHGFNFTDDWGTQRDLIINPRLWEDFFRPHYQRIFAAIHAAGWHVWMHSCGKINSILESLIDIGVDVIELQQPKILGIEEIGRRYRGRVCFASLCDIQHTLPAGSEAEIQAEAERLLAHWATPNGGFILIDYGDGEAIGASLDKKQVMLNAFLKADLWAGGKPEILTE